MPLELIKRVARGGEWITVVAVDHPPIPDVLSVLRPRVMGRIYGKSEPTIFYPRDVAWGAVLDLHRQERHSDATTLAMLLLWCDRNGNGTWEIRERASVTEPQEG